MDSRRRGRGGSFSIGHLFGDPFALATISLALLGWLIAIVGSVITTTRGNEFNRFYWWALAYMLCCIVGVTALVLTAATEQHAIAVVGFLAVAVTYNTFAVSAVVFSTAPEQEAAAAGFILLSVVSLLWIGYFGSSDRAAPRGYIDSFALAKDQRMSMRGSRPMSTNPYDTRAPTAGVGAAHPEMYTSSGAMNKGLEQSSNLSGYPNGSAPGMQYAANGSQSRFAPMGGAASVPQQSAPRSPVAGQAPGGGFGGDLQPVNHGATSGDVGAPAEYPYRAKAIYSYEANPDDANEISFTKHEILEVSDVSGRWWQAKKENGETGIAPSNYLILL